VDGELTPIQQQQLWLARLLEEDALSVTSHSDTIRSDSWKGEAKGGRVAQLMRALSKRLPSVTRRLSRSSSSSSLLTEEQLRLADLVYGLVEETMAEQGSLKVEGMLKACRPALTDEVLSSGEGAAVEPPYAVGAYHTLRRKMLPSSSAPPDSEADGELTPIQLQQLWLAKLLHEDALSVSSCGGRQTEADAPARGTAKGSSARLLMRVLSMYGRSAKQTLRTLRRHPSFNRIRGVHAREVEALEAAANDEDTDETSVYSSSASCADSAASLARTESWRGTFELSLPVAKPLESPRTSRGASPRTSPRTSRAASPRASRRSAAEEAWGAVAVDGELTPIQQQQLWLARLLEEDALSVTSHSDTIRSDSWKGEAKGGRVAQLMRALSKRLPSVTRRLSRSSSSSSLLTEEQLRLADLVYGLVEETMAEQGSLKVEGMLKACRPALTDEVLSSGEGAAVEPPYAVGAYHTLRRKMLPSSSAPPDSEADGELTPIQLQQLWLAKLLHEDALSVSSCGGRQTEADAPARGTAKGSSARLLMRVLSMYGRSAKQTLRTLRRHPSFNRIRGVHAREVEALEAAANDEDTDEAASVYSPSVDGSVGGMSAISRHSLASSASFSAKSDSSLSSRETVLARRPSSVRRASDMLRSLSPRTARLVRGSVAAASAEEGEKAAKRAQRLCVQSDESFAVWGGVNAWPRDGASGSHSRTLECAVHAPFSATIRGEDARAPEVEVAFDASAPSACGEEETSLESVDASGTFAAATIPSPSVAVHTELCGFGYSGLGGYSACRAIRNLGERADAALSPDALQRQLSLLDAVVAAPGESERSGSLSEDRLSEELRALHAKKQRLQQLVREMYALRSTDQLHLRSAKRLLRLRLDEISLLEWELAEEGRRLFTAHHTIEQLTGQTVRLQRGLAEVIACSRILAHELRNIDDSLQLPTETEARAESDEAPSFLEMLETGCRRAPKHSKRKSSSFLSTCLPYREDQGENHSELECDGRPAVGVDSSDSAVDDVPSDDASDDGSVDQAMESAPKASSSLWQSIGNTADWLRTWTRVDDEGCNEVDGHIPYVEYCEGPEGDATHHPISH